MISINGELVISENGTIWFNQGKDGRCVLRIHGLKIEPEQIQNFKEKEQLIDIRIDNTKLD